MVCGLRRRTRAHNGTASSLNETSDKNKAATVARFTVPRNSKGRQIPLYTLNLNNITSPSATVYSLPSERIAPASRAADSVPSRS